MRLTIMYVVTSPEDQVKFILPTNRDTELLYYNCRLIIDDNVVKNPRAWQVSKVNRLTAKGVTHFTCAQTMFDPTLDYIETDSDGNVIGMWANYYSGNGNAMAEEADDPQVIYAAIKYSGKTPEIKVGGGSKTLTVGFYIEDQEIDFQPGAWTFNVDGEDVFDKITVVSSKDNQIKIKFAEDTTYIGKILNVVYTSDEGISTSLQLEIKSL